MSAERVIYLCHLSFSPVSSPNDHLNHLGVVLVRVLQRNRANRCVSVCVCVCVCVIYYNKLTPRILEVAKKTYYLSSANWRLQKASGIVLES
jgi:hypothetical protein